MENLTAKQVYFNELAKDYLKKIEEVVSAYQVAKFGEGNAVTMKKELLRTLGFSANLARMLIQEEVIGTSTMLHCLDHMEDILGLYDPAQQASDREALLKRKMYFVKKYAFRLDLEKPIVQK